MVPKKEENELVFPKEIPESTQMIVPNINFLSSPPFFVKKEKSYIYFYRTHLAQDVDVDYDPENMLLVFKIFSHHTLSKIEMMATKVIPRRRRISSYRIRINNEDDLSCKST